MRAVTIRHGDSRVVLRGLPDNSVDSVVSDAPYALVSIVKRFGSASAAEAKSEGGSGVYRRASAGFMGQTWDTGETAFDPAFWGEVLRVLKPGGHIVIASGTRTYHRLACAIEDAGFEIRDMVSWLYGSGFPKSHNHGPTGTALKPACEPWCLARKPLIGSVAENLAAFGTGTLNIDVCRVPVEPAADASQLRTMQRGVRTGDDGWGMSTLKGDAPEVLRADGRWPANVVHDGSDEVVAAFPLAGGQRGDLSATGRPRPSKHALGDMAAPVAHRARRDGGSAARFFYSAKASRADRCGSDHPTVKPIALMQWLCRLVTPPGGLILDPFAGSGTTGSAALREGFRAILVEREGRFVGDIHNRISLERVPA